ncbi:glycosyltransferase [Flavobacterium sp. T12S277]|uniref:glycosyltransferase n=1 Tax=Flavobacterium sp. T12S277 TaxID=3402752 RepID=UPI003AE0D954
MKILMVAMASQHFFRWVEQLENAGHEVYWFDVLDSKKKVERISWVNQIVEWKLRWNYPGREFLKSKFRSFYNFIQQFNEYNTATIFEEKLLEIKPDLVHSFEMQLSCLPILEVMEKYSAIQWVYSSWGSDMFFSEQIGISDVLMSKTLKRTNYLITDCFRDFKIATEKGFGNKFLGVFPGNGGFEFKEERVIPPASRKTILIKGYNNEIGKGITVVKALNSEILLLLNEYRIVVFGADLEIKDYIQNNSRFANSKITVYLRSEFIENNELMRIMGESYIYIGNSLSDGLPNSLIEAMGMGAFPIQSNPGDATAELINDGQNGLLIQDALNAKHIEELLKKAILNPAMIENAFSYNINVIKERYDRESNRLKIIELYSSVEKVKN